MKRRLLILHLVLMISVGIIAQRVSLRVMSKTPVTGAEEARSLLFDHYGMMWVGTDQGVREFNGYGFRTYRSDAYSPGTLPNNNITSLAEDKEDRLWIGTNDGLVCYDRRKGDFKTYHLRGENARTIISLFVSADSTVWAGTNAGVSRYDAVRDDFIDINLSAGVRSFAEDQQGHLYIGTWEGGLLRLDIDNGQLVNYPPMSGRNTIASLLMDSKGRLWAGTWEGGIIRLDHPEDKLDPGIHKINEGRQDFRTFHQLVEDPVTHSVWGCCIEGLTRIDMDDVTQVENYPLLSFCYDMLTDGQGNLWVITRNQGIVRLSTKPAPFRLSHLDPAGQVLPVNRIQTVFTADGNRFWLGLQPYGLALYDRQADRVLYNTHIPGFGQMTGTEGIDVQTVSSVLQRHDGQVWIGSSRGILVWREGEAARVLQRNATPFIGDGNVNTFHSLKDGVVLVGQTVGLGLAFSESKGRMLKMGEEGRDFSNCNVKKITEDHQHRLWLATENAGIIRLEGNVRRPQMVRCHQYSPVNDNYPISEATACYEDTNHRIWAISRSGGLFLYDAEKDCFEPVNHRFHIEMEGIYTIDGDKNGWLWLSTDRGLVRLKTSENRDVATCYTMEDGLEDYRFSSNGSFRFGNTLYYGSATGFFSFSPDSIGKWQQKPSVHLVVTDLLIDDRPFNRLSDDEQQRYSSEPPLFTREITIPSDIDKFSVGFALLTYMNTQQCRYAYRLNGYESKWHHVSADNRMATYQNLPDGTYELELRAIDSYGHLVELPYTITVRVLPPWYRTWWAYLIYLLLMGSAAYGVKEWYKNRLNRRARLQQRVSELLHYREMMVMKQFEGARKALEVEEQQHNSPDELFIQKAIDCVKQHLGDADYDREQFASDMCVSSSTLYNKLRALTGQSITSFINSIRLKEACRIMRQRPDIKMTELSMEVGFNTPKYFTKLFKKEFDMLPSEFIEKGRA